MWILVVGVLLTLVASLAVLATVHTFTATPMSGGGASGVPGASGTDGASGASGTAGANGNNGASGFLMIGNATLTADQSGTVFNIDAPPAVLINIPDATQSYNVFYDFVVTKLATQINVHIVSSGGNIIGVGVTETPEVLATFVNTLGSWRLISDGTQWFILFSNVVFNNQ